MTRKLHALPLVLLPILSMSAMAQDAHRGTDPIAILTHITTLAAPQMEGRMTGDPGNVRAAHYIAGIFRQAGLRPVGTARELDAKAIPDGTGYYQPFSVPWGVRRGRNVALSATLAGKLVRYHLGHDFDVTDASHGGSAKGKMVFVGYGLDTIDPDRDDFVGQDIHGKVALVLAGVPANTDGQRLRLYGSIRRKALAAQERGASALLVVLGPGEKPTIDVSTRAIDCRLPVLVVRREIADTWMQASGHSIAQMEKELAAGPCAFATGVTVDVSADVVPAPRTTANIVGFLPGSDPALKGEVVVIGGHMDHIGRGVFASMANRPGEVHPGADDNASGTAGVLALAEHFAAQRIHPKRSLLFICFSGEELGLLGSAQYVATPIIPLDHTVAMLNMDMIGRMVRDKLAVLGTGSSTVWRRMLDEMAPPRYLILQYTDFAGGGSDHESFSAKGIPVLFFFTGLHPDYHRPTDTADKIAFLDEARVVDLVADVAERVADTPTRPQPVIQPATGAGGPVAPNRPSKP